MKTNTLPGQDSLVIKYDCILFKMKMLQKRKEDERNDEANYQSYVMNSKNPDTVNKCKKLAKECSKRLKVIESGLKALSEERTNVRSSLLNIYRSKDRSMYAFSEKVTLFSVAKNLTITDRSGKAIEIVV